MQLKDILREKGSRVWTIQAKQTVHDALRMLVSHKIGALLVLNEDEKIVGIISERDIIRGCFEDVAHVEKTPVSKLMTKNIFVAAPEDDIRVLMATMTEKRVRHIPVLENGELKGIVSIGDVVKSLLQDSEHQIRYLKEYIYGSSL